MKIHFLGRLRLKAFRMNFAVARRASQLEGLVEKTFA